MVQPRGAGSRPKLLFIVNVDWFFVSHRLSVAQAAVAAGFDVHLACAFTDQRSGIEALGITTHPLPIVRGGAGAIGEIRTFGRMVKLLKRLQPEIVHLVTIKPVLLGGIAARLARIPHVVAAISGLGFVFIARGNVARLRRGVVGLLYRAALGGSNVTAIFQNVDDERLVRQMVRLRDDQVARIRGSGVDLQAYRPTPLSKGRRLVLFAARLLLDKGLREFVSAAASLKTKGVDADFVVAGDCDPGNPASASPEQLAAWRAEGSVEIVGFRRDMAGLIAAAHIVVLPSYREGMPKVLLEAAACGRAVITSDVPGCRDAIEPGRTGLLVPVKSVEPLADAMQTLIEDPRLCASLGNAGRDLAEREFAIETVVAATLDIYRRKAKAAL